MLGPELQTYKGDKFWMVMSAVDMLAPAVLVYGFLIDTQAHNPFRVIATAFLVVLILRLAWIISLRVTLHVDGIAYHSVFSEMEMRWDKVERFGYEATKRSIYSLPLGGRYHFQLCDGEGNKIRIGKRIANAPKLGQKLIELTTPELLHKAMNRYKSGEELDFGAIKVSRSTGMRIKRFYGYQEIPWIRSRVLPWSRGNSTSGGWSKVRGRPEPTTRLQRICTACTFAIHIRAQQGEGGLNRALTSESRVLLHQG